MEDHYTSKELTRWIIIRLNEWHQSQPPSPVISTPWVRRAIQDQDNIGWWQFLLGRIAKSMTTAHTHHLRIVRPRHRPETWTPAFITQIWEVSYAMWDQRNGTLHGDELTPTQLSALGLLRRQVKAEFTKGCVAMLQEHQWMLNENVQAHAMTQSFPRTQRWLDTIRLSRKAYQARSTPVNDLVRLQQAMREWLHPANPQQA